MQVDTSLDAGFGAHVDWPEASGPVDPARLAAAQNQFSRLPIDAIPGPSPLPPGSRVPIMPNPLFTGRTADLRVMAALCKSAAPIVVALDGPSGIGKTCLAIEFAYRYAGYFAGGVFWLSFADPTNVAIQVGACGGPDALNLWTQRDVPPLHEQVRRVRAYWRSPLPCLLIFDGCSAETSIEEWRPPDGGSRVLVTGRFGQGLSRSITSRLQLSGLSPAEALELLHAFRPGLPTDDEELGAIARELGGVPLSLHLAGGSMSSSRRAIAPAEYLAELRSMPPAAPGEHRAVGFDERDMPPHLARAIELSYDRLDPDDAIDALAIRLLARATYCAADAIIPCSLLYSAVDKPEARRDEAKLALERLIRLGLSTSMGEDSVQTFPLLAEFGRAALQDPLAQTDVEVAVLEEANRITGLAHAEQAVLVEPHLRALTDAALRRGDAHAAALCTALGNYLMLVGSYAKAQDYFLRALSVDETTYREQHLDIAGGLRTLGGLQRAQGRFSEARTLYERALDIRERLLGLDHPDTAESLNDLGGLLRDQGEYPTARRYYERALAIRERVLGPDHLDTAASLNDLAGVFRDQNEYPTARRYYERALAIRERVLGPDHLDTAASLNDLAGLLREQSEYSTARRYYERALAIRERVLGPDHLDTAASLNDLAGLLREQSEYSTARRYYERALAIRERVLGPDHLDTAASLNDLAGLLHVQSEYPTARRYYERALAIRERVLGPDHPDIAAALNDLAGLLQDQGDYEEARSLYERALAIEERSHGPQHVRVATALHSLASVLRDQADYGKARPLYERAVDIRERLLGPDHPDTAESINDLACLLRAQADYQTARPLYERALAIRERVPGPEHSVTAASLNDLAVLLHAQADFPAARVKYERALAIRLKLLGPNHPDIAASLHNLAGLHQDLGEYAQAREYFERASKMYECTLGPEHPDIATTYNSLAALLRAQGDLAAASPLYRHALSIRERSLGPNHPTTAASLNDLAGLLQDQGDYAAAHSHYERALSIRERVLGPNHPATADSLNDLAGLLQDQGDYAAARAHYERALSIRERMLGPNHPATAASLNDLAGLLQDQGDYAAARAHYERALSIRERVLGPEHPDTGQTLANLAVLLHNHDDDLLRARECLDRALRIGTRYFGVNSSEVIVERNYLALLLGAMGELPAARKSFEDLAIAIEHSEVLEPPNRQQFQGYTQQFAREMEAAWTSNSERGRSSALGRAAGVLSDVTRLLARVTQAERAVLERISKRWREVVTRESARAGRLAILKQVASPYNFTIPVEGLALVGRTDVFERIESHWSGPGARDSLLIHGHRRMGKTSVAQAIVERCHLGDDTRRIYRSMETVQLRHEGDLLYALASALQLEFPESLPKPRRHAYRFSDARTAFDRFLRRLEQVRGQARIVMVLDEFELLFERLGAGEAEEALQNLRGQTNTYSWLALALVGLSDLQDLQYSYKSAILGWVGIRVGFLDHGQVADVLANPARDPDFQLEYTQEALTHIAVLTNGQPYLVQVIGDLLVQRYNRIRFTERRDHSGTFSIEDVKEVVDNPAFYETASAYFTGVYGQATRGQQGQISVLTALAPYENGLSEDALRSAVQLDDDTLNEALTALERHAVLYRSDSQLLYSVPLMRRWMERTYLGMNPRA